MEGPLNARYNVSFMWNVTNYTMYKMYILQSILPDLDIFSTKHAFHFQDMDFWIWTFL